MPIILTAPAAVKSAFDDMVPAFEKKTGHKVKFKAASAMGMNKLILSGLTVDVPVVQAPYTEILASGRVVPGSAITLATVQLAIAIKKGAPKPDISTAEALKKTLLNAKSIGSQNADKGASAPVVFDKVLEKLGIAAQVQPKIRLAKQGDSVMLMLAKGEVDFGITFTSEITHSDVELGGVFPNQLAPPVSFVGFVSSHALDPVASKALLDYLASPANAAVYRAHGMQPGR